MDGESLSAVVQSSGDARRPVIGTMSILSITGTVWPRFVASLDLSMVVAF